MRDKTVVLRDVIDTRTNNYHSIAVVSEKNVKYFIPAVDEEEEE